jgi:hypothetical protein
MENRKIRPTPESLVDSIAEALRDLDVGRTHGPYTTAKEAIKALENRAKDHSKNQSK